jgi:DNA-binding MurR/RpiR family transcriptional regulator
MITRESLEAYADAGVVAAARGLHFSTRTINRLARKLGVEFKTYTDQQRERRRRERARLAPSVRALSRQRFSQARICDELGISRAVLRRIAAEHHIDINSRSFG